MSPAEKLCFGHASSVMLVCAHPDDEIIGAGIQLLGWREVLIVYVTNGAPHNEVDAKAAGFTNAAAYAEARRGERDNAIRLIHTHRSNENSPIQTFDLDWPDQEVAFHMVETAHVLADLIRRIQPDFVVTHPYEGGHPDHDSTAFAVAAACSLCKPRSGKHPVHAEMTSYHAGESGMITGAFLQTRPSTFITVPLSETEQDLKNRLFSAYATQSKVLQYFQTAHERFRLAPSYDFCSPPHSGRLWYENFNWGITAPHWRHLARIALPDV